MTDDTTTEREAETIPPPFTKNGNTTLLTYHDMVMLRSSIFPEKVLADLRASFPDQADAIGALINTSLVALFFRHFVHEYQATLLGELVKVGEKGYLSPDLFTSVLTAMNNDTAYQEMLQKTKNLTVPIK